MNSKMGRDKREYFNLQRSLTSIGGRASPLDNIIGVKEVRGVKEVKDKCKSLGRGQQCPLCQGFCPVTIYAFFAWRQDFSANKAA